jgi:hypothetical protein
MKLPHERIIGILGLINLLPLIYLTPLKDHEQLHRADALWFGAPGLVLIALWGLAYMAAARHWALLPGMMAVFALEKALYSTHWMLWLSDSGDRMEFLLARDPLTAFFLGGYGAWDGLCAIYFASLAVLAWQRYNGAQS